MISKKNRLVICFLLATTQISCDCGRQVPPLDMSQSLSNSQVRAGRTTKESDLVGGPWSDGRVGDYKLYNNRARFIIQDVDPARSVLGLYGGHLIDADLVRNDDSEDADVLAAQNEVIGLLGVEPTSIEVANDGRGGQPAKIRVRGIVKAIGFLPEGALGLGLKLDDVNLEVIRDYTLAPNSTMLKIKTEVVNRSPFVTDTVYMGDAYYFTGYTQTFMENSGFDFLIGSGSYLAAVGDRVAYAISTDFDRYELIGNIASVIVAIVYGTNIAPQGSAFFIRYFSVGEPDVSSPTEPLLQMLRVKTALLRGVLTDESTGAPLQGARIDVQNASGDILTTAATKEDGSYRAVIPLLQGETERQVQVLAQHTGRANSQTTTITVRRGGGNSLDLVVPAGGQLQASVRDQDSGELLPARIQCQGTGGYFRFAITDRPHTLSVPPGTYTVTASRGFEYTYDQQTDVVIPENGLAQVELSLQRVVDTTGYLSADLHLHSVNSTDSRQRLDSRVTALAAEGVEFAAATDHDFITDYNPIIAQLELGSFIYAVPGCEVSTFAHGHFNGFPLRFSPDLPANGAIPWYNAVPSDLFQAIRDQGEPSVLVQVNHPRFQGSGFFATVGLNQGHGHATADPEEVGFPAGTDLDDLSFDLIEVFNGKREDDTFGSEEEAGSLGDYFALLNAGRIYTMTGNSDSHQLSHTAGLPRNYIASSTDLPQQVEVDAYMGQLKAGNNVVVGGPFVRFTASSAGRQYNMGELVPAESGADLQMHVQAPDWIDVSTVQIVENGVTIATYSKDAGEIGGDSIVRFDQSVHLRPLRDAWYMLIVQGQQSMAPVLNEIPLTLTNAIFFDVDQDGVFRAPWDRN